MALSPSTVVVLPFEVRGGPAHEYLREGMVSLIGAGINADGELRAVDTRALFNHLEDAGDKARRRPESVARRFGAGWYVRGEVVDVDGHVQIAASLHRAGSPGSAARGAPVRVEGPADSLVALIERLTHGLVSAQRGGAARRPAYGAAHSTGSLEAMRLYLEGEREMRAGRYAEALRAYQRAVAEDSTFAMAYYRIGIAAGWLDGRLGARLRAEALRRSRGLPPLDSMLVLAASRQEHGDPAEAERLYHAVLSTRRDDVEAWHQLGEVLYHWGPMIGRPPTAARHPFERVLHYEPGNFSALLHLARLAGREGRLAALDSLAARARRAGPNEQHEREIRALVAYAHDDAQARAQLLVELASVGDAQLYPLVRTVAVSIPSPVLAFELASLMRSPMRGRTVRDAGAVLEAQLLASAGRFAEAAAVLAAHTGPDAAWAVEYDAMLAALPFSPARPPELRALRSRVERLPSVPSDVTVHSLLTVFPTTIYPPSRLALLGLLDLRLGDDDAALAHAARLDALDAAEYHIAPELARLLRASVARRRGDARRALDLLGPPGPTGPTGGAVLPVLLSYTGAFERWLRAELLRELGRDAEALQWYGTFPDPAVHDLMFLAPAHLRRAEIHERRGDRADADHHRRRATELWRAADPALLRTAGRAERSGT